MRIVICYSHWSVYGRFYRAGLYLSHPYLVKAFVAIDSTPYGDYYSTSDKWWLRQIEWMAKLFPEKLLKSSIAKQTALTDAGRKNMAAMIADYGKSELCHLMGLNYTAFLDDNRECDILCPVLLIVGKKDKTGKVKVYNKEWAKCTGYPLVWIAGAAHNSNVDNPAVVNEEIRNFLKTLK